MVWLEYFGVITGLLYLFLEIKQHKAMWVVGFLTSLVYVFVFLFAKIYADMGLQTYYVGISVYGFYQWTRKKHETHTENDSLPSDRILYTSEPSAFRGDYRNIGRCIRHLMVSPSSIHDSPSRSDAFTTSVGIVATWMLARRIIEHWIFG